MTPVAAVPPIVTVAPAAKLVPVIVTVVPPPIGPEVGATLVTAGGRPRYVKALARVPLWLSAFVTVTPTSAARHAPASVAVIVVLLTTRDAGGRRAADRHAWRPPRSWCR